MPHRTVTLVLVDGDGQPRGTLPPLPPINQWMTDIGAVLDATRSTYGIDVTLLRALFADFDRPDRVVTYLAQYDGPDLPELMPADGEPVWLRPDPRRMPWAIPGGPAAALDWACDVLAGYGRAVTGRRQVRAWSYAAVWRLDTDRGPAWLKVLPPFLAYEGALLAWLSRPTTPALLGADGTRVVMANIGGPHRFDATAAERELMLADLLAIQTDAAGRVPELLGLGVPDLRGDALADRIGPIVDRRGGALAVAERIVLDKLVAGLPERFAELAACGVPDTLVHGDFHPGNAGMADDSHGIIDWAEAAVGHPAIDLLLLCGFASNQAAPLIQQWCAHWRATIPGCAPERAIELAAPLWGLRDAVFGDLFLSSIEPSERIYHHNDGLRDAVRAVS
jgi:hypothetical protein